MADGWQQLTELGAIDAERRMTTIGKQMARLPVDVKLARMLVAAQAAGCLRPMLVIASFLGIQDPRERPPEARGAADSAHAQFADGRSEFVGVLRLWDAYRQAHEDPDPVQAARLVRTSFPRLPAHARVARAASPAAAAVRGTGLEGRGQRGVDGTVAGRQQCAGTGA